MIITTCVEIIIHPSWWTGCCMIKRRKVMLAVEWKHGRKELKGIYRVLKYKLMVVCPCLSCSMCWAFVIQHTVLYH